MAKPRTTRRHFVVRRAPRTQEGLPGESPESDDDRRVPQDAHLLFQVRLATGELGPRRTVLGWSATHGRGHVAIVELEPIETGHGGPLVREAGTVKGPIEPVPASVAREDPPGPVATVGGGGEANDQKAGCGIPEPRDGPPPVLPISEGRSLRAGDGLAVSHEAGAPSTRDDGLLKDAKPVRGHE